MAYNAYAKQQHSYFIFVTNPEATIIMLYKNGIIVDISVIYQSFISEINVEQKVLKDELDMTFFPKITSKTQEKLADETDFKKETKKVEETHASHIVTEKMLEEAKQEIIESLQHDTNQIKEIKDEPEHQTEKLFFTDNMKKKNQRNYCNIAITNKYT